MVSACMFGKRVITVYNKLLFSTMQELLSQIVGKTDGNSDLIKYHMQ